MLFKPRHFESLIADPERVDLIEVHAENYFGAGGLLHAQLGALRQHLPLSIHGVGLSLGGFDRPEPEHLRRLRQLCDRYEPALVSEHLAWSTYAGQYLSDLLPIPYSDDALTRVSAHVNEVQDRLNRPILIENPARYFNDAGSDLTEAAFLQQLCERTGCGLLFDLNNLIVSEHNCGESQADFLSRSFLAQVQAIHLAGHSRMPLGESEVLIDDHGGSVADRTWALYAAVIDRVGPLPTVIEWDRNVPPFALLAAEVDCARSVQTQIALRHLPEPVGAA